MPNDPSTDQPDVVSQAGGTSPSPTGQPQNNVQMLPQQGLQLNNMPSQPADYPKLLPGQTTPSGPVAPMNQADYAKSQVATLEAQKGNIQDQANNLSSYQQDVAAINAKAAKEDAERQATQEEMMAKAMQDVKTRDALLRQKVQEASAQQVDPHRLWESKSTGTKILAGIGLMLGAVGAGLSHGRLNSNPALDVINGAINNDIDAQKHNIENNWKTIQATHGLDEDAFNKDLHAQVWANNYRTAALERVKYDVATRGAMSDSETVKNNAQKAIVDINAQQDAVRYNQFQLAQKAAQAQLARMQKLETDANKDVQDLVKEKGVDPEAARQEVFSRPLYKPLVRQAQLQMQEQVKALSKNGLPGQIGPITPGQAIDHIRQMDPETYNMATVNLNAGTTGDKPKGQPIVPDLEGAKDQRERSVVFNGKLAIAPSKEDAESFRKDMDHASHANALIQELIDTRAANGGGTLSPTVTSTMIAKRDAIINELNEMSGVSRLNEKEIELVNSMLPSDPNAWSLFNRNGIGVDPTDQLKNAQNIINQKLGGSFQSLVANQGSYGGTSTDAINKKAAMLGGKPAGSLPEVKAPELPKKEEKKPEEPKPYDKRFDKYLSR